MSFYSPGTGVLSVLTLFSKRLDMLSQSLALSITKKVSSYSLVLGLFTAPKIQKFHKSISIYLKINTNIFNSKLFL